MKHNEPKPIKIPLSAYSSFKRRFNAGEFGDQRLGQAIVNQFWPVALRVEDNYMGSPVSDLFHVSDKEINSIVLDFVDFI